MRVLRLAIYALLVFLTLLLAFPRLRVLFALLRGPYGWVEDPPHPFLWPVVALVAVAYAGALILDLGWRRVRTPRWAHGALVGAFALAVLGAVYDPAPGRRTPQTISEAAPWVQAEYVLDRAEEALRAYHKRHGRFPADREPITRTLVDEDGRPLLGTWRHRLLGRRPWRVEVFTNARGPVTRVPAGRGPGTLLYAVDAERGRYWLTAIVGTGAPATPEIYGRPEKGPVVRTNAPRGGLFR